jgi:hypothetical protein
MQQRNKKPKMHIPRSKGSMIFKMHTQQTTTFYNETQQMAIMGLPIGWSKRAKKNCKNLLFRSPLCTTGAPDCDNFHEISMIQLAKNFLTFLSANSKFSLFQLFLDVKISSSLV